VPRAEVVEAQAYAAGAQRDERRAFARHIDETLLLKLEHEGARGQAELVEREQHLVGEARRSAAPSDVELLVELAEQHVSGGEAGERVVPGLERQALRGTLGLHREPGDAQPQPRHGGVPGRLRAVGRHARLAARRDPDGGQAPVPRVERCRQGRGVGEHDADWATGVERHRSRPSTRRDEPASR
jgi:hypothetical protein